MANFLSNLGNAYVGYQQGENAQLQQEQARQLMLARKQAMEYQAFNEQQARAEQARQLQERQRGMAALNQGFAPPPVANQPAHQTPAPGQASVPMTQGQPQVPGGQPQGQPIPPYRTVDSAAQGQPQAPGFVGDPQMIAAEIARIKDPRDRAAAMQQLLGQSQGQPQVPGGQPQLTPPPTQPKSGMPTVEDLWQRMDQAGVPMEDRMAALQLPQVQNLFKMQSEDQKQKYNSLMGRLQEERLAQSMEQSKVKQTMDERRVAQGDERLSILRGKVASAGVNADVDPDVLDNQIALARAGLPKSQIVAGWGGNKASAQWNKVASGAIDQIMAENPGMSKTDAAKMFGQGQMGYKAEGSGKMAEARTASTISANMAIASDEARSMIDVAQNYSDKVSRTEFPNLNALANAVKKGTGDVAVVQLNTALNSLVNSYARAISPKGVPTVSDKDHAREIVNSAYSNGQLSGIFDVMKQEMSAALSSAKRHRAGGEGQPQSGPKVGTEEGGYRFKGGDPSKQSSWEKI